MIRTKNPWWPYLCQWREWTKFRLLRTHFFILAKLQAMHKFYKPAVGREGRVNRKYFIENETKRYKGNIFEYYLTTPSPFPYPTTSFILYLFFSSNPTSLVSLVECTVAKSDRLKDDLINSIHTPYILSHLWGGGEGGFTMTLTSLIKNCKLSYYEQSLFKLG